MRRRRREEPLEPSVVDGMGVTPRRIREDHWAVAALAFALVAGFGMRFHLALTDDGVYGSQEILGVLEPAHRLVFGYGWLTDEPVRGGWALTGLAAGLMKLGAAAGAGSARVYLTVVRLSLASMSGLVAVAAVALARRHQARWLGAAVAGATAALAGLFVYFSARPVASSVAMLPLLAGFSLAVGDAPSRFRVRAGALLVGLGLLFEPLSALFALGLLGHYAFRRQWWSFFDALWPLGLCVSAWAALDAAALGAPFRSLQPLWALRAVPDLTALRFYGQHLVESLGPLGVALVAFGLVGCLRAPAVGLSTLAYLVVRALLGAPELELLLPGVAFLCALCGLGVDMFLTLKVPLLGRAAAVLCLFAASFSAVTHRQLTWGQLGVNPQVAEQSAYDVGGPENRLLLRASERPDLCGLEVLTRSLARLGGYAYLHRRVPLYSASQPPRSPRQVNYLIARAATQEGKEVATEGDLALVRLANDSCENDARFDWKLH